jgi:hypothetical protein
MPNSNQDTNSSVHGIDTRPFLAAIHPLFFLNVLLTAPKRSIVAEGAAFLHSRENRDVSPASQREEDVPRPQKSLTIWPLFFNFYRSELRV